MDNKKVIEDWKNRVRPTKAEYYEMRVKKFEANGLTRSDAQALVDANDLRLKNFALTDDPNARCGATIRDELATGYDADGYCNDKGWK
tara:strand:+ start:868 stop:1131 length:264 start_codon:yes stop_codon:yes gene_type:complete